MSKLIQRDHKSLSKDSKDKGFMNASRSVFDSAREILGGVSMNRVCNFLIC